MDSRPKERILSIPSEYITFGLIGIFVLSVLGGIIFLAAKTSDSSLSTSLPVASSGNALSAAAKTKEVPNVIPPQPPAGPTIATSKPKATPTPKPSTTSTPSPTPTATPSPTPSTTSSPTSTPDPATKVVELKMEPSTSSPNVNQTFTVAFNLDTKSDSVSAADLRISFDKAKLEIQSFTAGSYLPLVLSAATYDNSAGTASIAVGANLGSPVNGTGTLATITFRALSSGSTAPSYISPTQTTSAGRTGNSLNTSSGTTITINP